MSGLLTATGGGSPDEPMVSGSSPAVSPGDYAPSPNTSSQAIHRANQLRVQNLLRRLLMESNEANQIDTVRVLRRTLREIDFQLSWLTQVDFLETIERLLRNEQQQRPQVTKGGESGPDLSWRLVHDASQLLLESMGRLGHEIDQPLLESIVPSVVENLGHSRSEVRRASLLLLNQLLNERPHHFRLLMRLFIDYGLTNYRNKQAQRGSILSLPLLISERIVERGEDLGPLIRCLSELLLIDSNEQLFYSLFLAMQRIHLTIGDAKFNQILANCEPEAVHLYKQAASRSNSLVLPPNQQQQIVMQTQQRRDTEEELAQLAGEGRRKSSARSQQQPDEIAAGETEDEQLGQRQQQARQHVTFEQNLDKGQQQQQQQQSARTSLEGGDDAGSGQRPISSDTSGDDEDESLLSSSSFVSGSNYLAGHAHRSGQNFSSEVSSTCSSDAHLVNPAHYMTKAALEGNPLDHYDEIHHVDHSNVTSLAINDFGPVCNTPTTELQPQPAPNLHVSQLRSGGGQFGRGLDSATPTGGSAMGSLASSELKFGIFPRHLIQATLNAPRGPDRYEAMQELMCLVRESPINHLAILMTYFDSFMDQFLAKILLGPASQHQQSDCKLELVAIDMIETIIIKTKVSTMQFIRPIVSLLMRALAIDAAHNQMGGGGQQQQQTNQQQRLYLAPVSIFRDNTCRVLHKMMAYLPPQHVLDSILEHKHHRSWLVREETINRVTAALLEYDRNEFNLTKLCYHVLPMLADESPAVRLAALECMATLAHVLGPERIGTLLTAAEAVQTGCDYDGLLDAINARLMRHTLPRCQSNGIVRYALKPFLAHHQVTMATSGAGDGQHSSSPLPPLAADVRWVLESPALHHSHHHHETHHNARDEAGHAHHHHSDHAHHRLGVYSPPTRDERRRKSSIGIAPLDLIGLASDQNQAEHHHHHHHHQHLNHDEHQHKPASSAAHRRRSMSSSQRQAAADDPPPNSDQQHAQDNSETRRQSSGGSGQRPPPEPSAATRRKSQTPAVGETGNHSAVGGHQRNSLQRQTSQDSELAKEVARSRKPSVGSSSKEMRSQQQNCRQQQRSQLRPAAPMRRSNSQDSVSSTDTNKVLFQFYLGKFKQSLAESNGANQYQAVLPSDSIIYADINQAYELSRRQTRFQQTSLELGADDGQEAAGRNVDSFPASATSVAPESNLNTVSSSSRGGPTASREDKARNETISGRSSSRRRPTLARMNSRDQHQDSATQNSGHHSGRQQQRPTVASDDQQTTSGSESPQTVREAVSTSPNAAARRAPSLSSRPSIQRQKPIGGDPANESPVGRRQSSPDHNATSKATSARRDSSSGHSRRHTVSAIGAEKVLAEGGANENEIERQHETEQTADVESSSCVKRQKSRSLSKQRGSSSGELSQGHAQRQASGSQSGDSVGQRQTDCGLSRQDSEAATVSSVNTSASISSASRSAQAAASISSASRSAQAAANSSEQLDREERNQVEAHTDRGLDSRAHHRRRAASKSQQRHQRASSHSRVSDDKQRDNVDEDREADQKQDEEGARERRRATRRHASRNRHPDDDSASRDQTDQEAAGATPGGDQQAHKPTARLIKVHRQHGAIDQTNADHSGAQRTGGLEPQANGRGCLVSPSLSNSVNIRQLLENVAQVEGPFAEPQLALKVAMSALESACWSTKVEGLLAQIRLVAHHPETVLTDGRLHEIVARTAEETRNLRSTVARAAIFALGDYCARLKRLIEPELDVIVKCLLLKSMENTTFIRDDLKRALTELVDHLTPWRVATLLIQHGGQHKSVHVRRMASQFVAQCCERLGPAKALVGAREISHLLLPAAARFAQDQSPHTRYYGRLILSKLMHHNSFERLLRRNLTSTLYRSTIGIIESIKRRGCGTLPDET